jgi:hypothetical protein
MRISIQELTGPRLYEGYGRRAALLGDLASELGASSPSRLFEGLSRRCACITLLAGSGSRWVKSLQEAKAAGLALDADDNAPRGLYPVRNAIAPGGPALPIASYALKAVQGLGTCGLVVRGWQDDIARRILVPLGYAPGSWRFVEQDTREGKPRGHGDAAYQSMELWRDKDYVIFNFGGDASSPYTARAALAALAALDAADGRPGLLMPVTRLSDAAYPVAVDEGGLPRGFGHAKLKGGGHASARAGSDAAVDPTDGRAYSNVGLRLYKARELAAAIEYIREHYWSAEAGYAIPGNDPEGGEFALDNADEFLASQGRARLLYVARPEELSPVKAFSDLERFERDIELVWRDRALLAE